MTEDIEQVLFTKEQIAARVAALGARIHADYAESNLLLVGTLKGAFLFLADLARAIDLQLQVDFVSISSYGDGASSSGAIQIRKDLDRSPAGFDVLIVEDIVDSGRTLAYLQDNLCAQRAASIEICTLFDKPSGRVVPVIPKYTGFTVPDGFIVGYGMDYAEKYRSLPFVGLLRPEIYGEKQRP
ncbi:MAG: hypoxanthine phosphoribosyltransferase [Ethanoligenens sp.]